MVYVDTGKVRKIIRVRIIGIHKFHNEHLSKRIGGESTIEELRNSLSKVDDQIIFDLMQHLSEELEVRVMMNICSNYPELKDGWEESVRVGRTRYTFRFMGPKILKTQIDPSVKVEYLYRFKYLKSKVSETVYNFKVVNSEFYEEP